MYNIIEKGLSRDKLNELEMNAIVGGEPCVQICGADTCLHDLCVIDICLADACIVDVLLAKKSEKGS